MPKILLLLALMLIAFGRVLPALADPPAAVSLTLGTNYKKNKVVGENTTFTPTDHTIVSVLRLKGIDKSSQYRVRWSVVKLDEQQAFKMNADDKKEHVVVDFSFDAKKQKSNLFTSTFSFSPPSNWPARAGAAPKDWPTGTYRVEWLRDGQPLRSVDFSIRAPSTTNTTTAQ